MRNVTTKLLLAAAVAVLVAGPGWGADTSATDELVHRLRQQSSENRKIVNRVNSLDSDLRELSGLMERSGVMDKQSMDQVRDVVNNVDEAGNKNLRSALDNINSSITKADERQSHISAALDDQKKASNSLEKAQRMARQKASRVKKREKLDRLSGELKELMEKTQAASAKELQNEEVSEAEKNQLAEDQKRVADRLEQLRKEFDAEAKDETLDAKIEQAKDEKNTQSADKQENQENGEKAENAEKQDAANAEKPENGDKQDNADKDQQNNGDKPENAEKQDNGEKQENGDKQENAENGESQENKEAQQQQAAENADKLKDMEQKAEDIAKSIEDNKFRDAAEQQKDLLDQLKDL